MTRSYINLSSTIANIYNLAGNNSPNAPYALPYEMFEKIPIDSYDNNLNTNAYASIDPTLLFPIFRVAVTKKDGIDIKAELEVQYCFYNNITRAQEAITPWFRVPRVTFPAV